jgi:hypothetical protein
MNDDDTHDQQVNVQGIFDIAVLINRYKNLIKIKLLESLSDAEGLQINFSDSLFNFINKACVNSIDHMNIIENINGNFDLASSLKLLYLNNAKILVPESNFGNVVNTVVSRLGNKDYMNNIIQLQVLQEYYGPFSSYDYSMNNKKNKSKIFIELVQNDNGSNTSKKLELITIQTIDFNAKLNDIKWIFLLFDKEQLTNLVQNSNGLNLNNIKRLLIIFEHILNNSALINLDFFNINKAVDKLSILDLCYKLYLFVSSKITYNEFYQFPQEEFIKRLDNFMNRVMQNTTINQIKTAEFTKNKEYKIIKDQDLIEYYNYVRNIDLKNNSVIYNYAANKRKQIRYNNELYHATRYIGVNSNDKCKTHNNFIRDMTLDVSNKFNKRLLYGKSNLMVYFKISMSEYLKDIIYARSQTVLTLVHNTVATFKMPLNIDIDSHIVQVILNWYNIFLILDNYGDDGIILPYGTELQIEFMIPRNNLGAYTINTLAINKISALPVSNINTFIQTARSKNNAIKN